MSHDDNLERVTSVVVPGPNEEGTELSVYSNCRKGARRYTITKSFPDGTSTRSDYPMEAAVRALGLCPGGYLLSIRQLSKRGSKDPFSLGNIEFKMQNQTVFFIENARLSHAFVLPKRVILVYRDGKSAKGTRRMLLWEPEDVKTDKDRQTPMAEVIASLKEEQHVKTLNVLPKLFSDDVRYFLTYSSTIVRVYYYGDEISHYNMNLRDPRNRASINLQVTDSGHVRIGENIYAEGHRIGKLPVNATYTGNGTYKMPNEPNIVHEMNGNEFTKLARSLAGSKERQSRLQVTREKAAARIHELRKLTHELETRVRDIDERLRAEYVFETTTKGQMSVLAAREELQDRGFLFSENAGTKEIMEELKAFEPDPKRRKPNEQTIDLSTPEHPKPTGHDLENPIGSEEQQEYSYYEHFQTSLDPDIFFKNP